MSNIVRANFYFPIEFNPEDHPETAVEIRMEIAKDTFGLDSFSSLGKGKTEEISIQSSHCSSFSKQVIDKIKQLEQQRSSTNLPCIFQIKVRGSKDSKETGPIRIEIDKRSVDSAGRWHANCEDGGTFKIEGSMGRGMLDCLLSEIKLHFEKEGHSMNPLYRVFPETSL